MKINLLYENNIIQFNIEKPIKIRDILYSLKTKLDLQNYNLKIFDCDNVALGDNFEINRKDGVKERTFHLVKITKVEPMKKIPPHEVDMSNIEEVIMKATNAKEKLSKQPKQPVNSSFNFYDQLLNQEGLGFMRGTGSLSQLSNILRPLLQVDTGNQGNDMNFFAPLMFNPIGGSSQIRPSAPSIQPDETMLAQLISMGFDNDRSRRALIISNNSINHATELLLSGNIDLLSESNNNNFNEMIEDNPEDQEDIEGEEFHVDEGDYDEGDIEGEIINNENAESLNNEEMDVDMSNNAENPNNQQH